MLESLINQDFWVTLAGAAAVLLQFLLTAGVILRVILTRHPPGSSFAWILLVTILPYIGFILYVWLGERPHRPLASLETAPFAQALGRGDR